ncbi:MAG: hypothetical protein ABFS37_04070 [Acidobacteriota bacterium]
MATKNLTSVGLEEVLIPRNTWSDKEAYDAKARYLAQQFVKNFAEYNDFVSVEI